MRSPPVVANRLLGAAVGALVAVVAAGPGCTPEVEVRPPTAARVVVRGFTEATAVRELHAAPPYLLSVTDAGLDRWDLRQGAVLRVGAAAGMPAGEILAHELDRDGRALWLATAGAIARYDVELDRVTSIPPPPAELGIDGFAGVALGAAAGDAVWVGLARGLFRADTRGAWRATDITQPVHAVVEIGDDVWIGTEGGLYVAHRGGRPPYPGGRPVEVGPAVALGRDRGCDIARVDDVVPSPDGGALVLGVSQGGDQRVVLARGTGCDSYRVSPSRPWQAVASRPGEVLVLSERRVFALARPRSQVRRLARDGMRLIAVPRADGGRPVPSPLVLRPIDVPVPPGARALAAIGGEVMVGTDSLGIARLPAGGGRTVAWLRGRELTEGARGLSVACRAIDDCWVATGGRRAWRFDGAHFRPTADDGRTVVAVSEARGAVHGLLASGKTIAVAAPDGDGWTDSGVVVETPGRAAELAFARVSPSGLLWLGLRYRDELDGPHAYGVAQVDLAIGAVAYHHAGAEGALAIPDDVGDVAFLGDEAWLPSVRGAIQVKGARVVVHPWSAGATAVRAIAGAAGGVVYAAGVHGVGLFDGAAWSHPPRLAIDINDMALAADGRLWLATDRGLMIYDGARLRRFDSRRGLLEDDVVDLVIDRFERIWVRGPEGIALVVP
jgi:hypothetical protein